MPSGPAQAAQKETTMNSFFNDGPCAQIHRVLPLFGTVAGFAALLAVMAVTAARLI